MFSYAIVAFLVASSSVNALSTTTFQQPQQGSLLQLAVCNSNDPNQQFTMDQQRIVLTQTKGSNNVYLSWDIRTNDTGVSISMMPNSTGSNGYHQQWVYDSVGGTISVATMSKWCAAARGTSDGVFVVLALCKVGKPRQMYTYQSSTKQFVLQANSSVCLAASPKASCSAHPHSTYTYCNPDASVESRVADLVSRLTPADIQGILGSTNYGIPRLGVPPIDYGESLHGPLTSCGMPYTNPTTGYTSTGCPTSFPHVLMQSTSFNRTLWSLIGSAVSTEDRALQNQGIQASILWAPDINEFRDPRWGRGQEVPGEDPFLTSEWVYHFSTAMQVGEDERYLKVASTAKHFSAYDVENSDGQSRSGFNAIVSDHDLVQYHWPAFRSAVQRAHVQSIMCSYNAVNGIPSCANDFFNNVIVREQWQWPGFIVSDCGAIVDIQKYHHYTSNVNDTVSHSLKGGTDINCGESYNKYLLSSYFNGNITFQDMKLAASRVFRTMFYLGLMDPPKRVVYTSYNASYVDSPYHRRLAFETAQQGTILLKNNATPANNNKPILPLNGKTLRTVAVVGPNANSTQGLLSNYHGQNTLVNSQSLLAGIQRRGAADGFQVNFVPGCWQVACPTTSGFNDALTAANNADVTIAVMGLCSDQCPDPTVDNSVREVEGEDRLTTDLPGHQEDFIRALIALNKPVVVVFVHGGSFSIDWTAANAPAIVDALYPGEMGGDAITSVLFGDVSPSGRTTTTWYPTAFQKQRPLVTDMMLAPHTSGSAQIPGITHLYYDGPVLFPFGWGMSYTTFKYTWMTGSNMVQRIDAKAFGSKQTALPPFAVNVTNTGTVTSDVTALAFLTSKGIPSEPIQELFDFQRASRVRPGETVTLYFSLPPEVAATVNADGEERITPGVFSVQIGDVKATNNFVVGQVEFTGDAFEVFSLKKLRAEYELRKMKQ